jgi:hypothetical protein
MSAEELNEAAEAIRQAMSDGAKLTGDLLGRFILVLGDKEYSIPKEVVEHLEAKKMLCHTWEFARPRPVPPPKAIYNLTA